MNFSPQQMCEPVRKLPKCRYFRDITWVITTHKDNLVKQVVNCICPKDSVAYMIKRQAFTEADDTTAFKYSFACSPQSVSVHFSANKNQFLNIKKYLSSCSVFYVKEKNLADYLLSKEEAL